MLCVEREEKRERKRAHLSEDGVARAGEPAGVELLPVLRGGRVLPQGHHPGDVHRLGVVLGTNRHEISHPHLQTLIDTFHGILLECMRCQN